MIFYFASVVICMAQTKSQRRIYLWDVTLSMKGFGGKTPDIYNEVVKFLEQEINSITDINTEIIVLPFQESILERWKTRADESGKKEIIQKIKSYSNDKITNTNIVNPIMNVQTDIISSDKNNILVLLTDGTQSEKFGGKAELIKLIQNWEQYAYKNYAYCLYVMLTPEAIDEKVKEVIEQTEYIDVVTEPGKMKLIDLQPSELVKFNIKDDKGKPVEVPLIYKKNIALSGNIKIKVVAEDNQYIDINQTVEVKDSKISFEIKYKQSDEVLKVTLDEKTQIPLHIELVNKEEIRKTEEKIVSLTQSTTVLELINRPERTLRIKVR
jgi:hypothetical protein